MSVENIDTKIILKPKKIPSETEFLKINTPNKLGLKANIRINEKYSNKTIELKL